MDLPKGCGCLPPYRLYCQDKWAKLPHHAKVMMLPLAIFSELERIKNVSVEGELTDVCVCERLGMDQKDLSTGLEIDKLKGRLLFLFPQLWCRSVLSSVQLDEVLKGS